MLLVAPSAYGQRVWMDGAFPGYDHEAPAGSDRMLLVFCHAETDEGPGEDPVAETVDFTAVTYGGQALVQVVELLQWQQGGAGYSVTAEIWALDEAGIQAAAGSTIVATTTGPDSDSEARRISSVFYENIDQADPFGPTGTYGENDNNAQTLTVVLSGDDLTVGDWVVANSTIRFLASGATDWTWRGGVEEIGTYDVASHPDVTYSVADVVAYGTEMSVIVDVLNNGVGALAAVVLNASEEPWPPVITLVGSASVSVRQMTLYTDEGATAVDGKDGDITAHIVAGGDSVDTDTLGTYTITYNVTNSDGYAADTVTRTVIVEPEPDQDASFCFIDSLISGSKDHSGTKVMEYSK